MRAQKAADRRVWPMPVGSSTTRLISALWPRCKQAAGNERTRPQSASHTLDRLGNADKKAGPHVPALWVLLVSLR